jgi:FAD/FMN-containing dehydrogenase
MSNSPRRQNSKNNRTATAETLSHVNVSDLDLHERIKGQIILPEDSGYDEARAVQVGGIDHRPSLIVRVANVDDVRQVISLAHETGLDLSVYSGGHSSGGFGVADGGIMLDLRDMRELYIDAEGRTAWAETGLTAGEYTVATDAYGLGTGFGDTGSVGLGGITLGGGVGYLVRKHGMTIDNLLAAEVVTADGQLRRVDAENDPDLFWAIRGGGGNFGVATRFQFRLQPLGTILGGMLIFPATPEVITGFIAEADRAPEELSTIANIMPAPPMPFLPAEQHGRLIVMAMMVYAGNAEAGERVVAPFRKLAKPLADLLRPMRYPEMFPAEEEGFRLTAAVNTMFVEWIDRGEAENIVHYLQSSDAMMRAAQLRVLGGTMARVPNDATAFAHRQKRIMVNLAAFYKGAEEQAVRQAWLTDFSAALDQGDAGAYGNFVGNEGAERVRAIYPDPTWDRLRQIKARYDPTNLFHLNHNIPPA